MLTLPAIATWFLFASLVVAPLAIVPDAAERVLSLRPGRDLVSEAAKLGADPSFIAMIITLVITLALAQVIKRTPDRISAKESWYLLNGVVIHLLMVLLSSCAL